MAKKLTRSVYHDGVLLTAGTELTDEQAEQITNPKAFADPANATGPDANDTREFYAAVRVEGDDSALTKAVGSGRDNDPGTEQDTDDRAAAGARLARSGRASAPKAS